MFNLNLMFNPLYGHNASFLSLMLTSNFDASIYDLSNVCKWFKCKIKYIQAIRKSAYTPKLNNLSPSETENKAEQNRFYFSVPFYHVSLIQTLSRYQQTTS